MSPYPDPRKPQRLYQAIRLSRHWEKAQTVDRSFAGEMAHLRGLLSRLEIDGGFILDIAAGDGVAQSSTLDFFRKPQWTGLAVEMDPEKFAKLAFAYAGFNNIQLAKCIVTPENVVSLLKAYQVPQKPTLLNLDIDSYDLLVLQEMLKGDFKPRVISMEINENMAPPIYFTVKFDAKHFWHGDHFYGCSPAAAAAVVKPFGYVLESIQYNNAIFVHQDVAQGKIPDQPVAEAYKQGYLNRPDRKTLFPWNADVEAALSLSPADAMAYFNTLFHSYSGQFDLSILTSE